MSNRVYRWPIEIQAGKWYLDIVLTYPIFGRHPDHGWYMQLCHDRIVWGWVPEKDYQEIAAECEWEDEGG